MRAAHAGEQNFIFQRDVRNYIVEKAKEAGVPTFRALYVAEHESQFTFRNGFFEPQIEGDKGQSIGLWQIHLPAHPEVTYACAKSVECSTAWAMPRLLATPNIWSAWRFRFECYKDLTLGK